MKFDPINITLNDGSSVQIREARINDAQELIETMKEIFSSTEYLLVDEDEFKMTLEQETAWVKSFEDVPTSLLLVATHNNKIIGNIGIVGTLMKKMKHTAGIGISLKQEWRNRGIGKNLMQEGIKWAKDKTNIELLWLDVFSENESALSLYKNLGFTVDGQQKNFCKLKGNRYCDKIIMSLNLI